MALHTLGRCALPLWGLNASLRHHRGEKGRGYLTLPLWRHSLDTWRRRLSPLCLGRFLLQDLSGHAVLCLLRLDRLHDLLRLLRRQLMPRLLCSSRHDDRGLGRLTLLLCLLR